MHTNLFNSAITDPMPSEQLPMFHHPVIIETPTEPHVGSASVNDPRHTSLLDSVIDAGEDFEWYPTTQRMIDVVSRHIPTHEVKSIMDIGAGDGRVLVALAKRCKSPPILYGIEKSTLLVQAQPEEVVPVGTDFYEQNLTCLPADYIFCNPPYSAFETWACTIIESGYAKKAFLIIPQRRAKSEQIQTSLNRRKAKARVIHTDHFADAERQARAVVDIVEITYPTDDNSYRCEAQDPFDAWFDQNVGTFDNPEEIAAEVHGSDLQRQHSQETITGLVAAYDQEYALMEGNYQAIFKLDSALLKELGVTKDAVRDGIKLRMSGLKAKYWQLLFAKLKSITDRLSTETKEKFLKRLIGPTSIAFTADNAYAVVIWAVKHANRYYDEQLVKLFKDLSTFEGVHNYKSNQRTWEKDNWRYMSNPDDDSAKPTHYSLDYRIVVEKYNAMVKSDASYQYDYKGGLHKSCHEVIEDITAVLGNLGFILQATPVTDPPTPSITSPRNRCWTGGVWEDFHTPEGEILFQVKAYQNGNLHLRFKPNAIRALNVEAGRLMGWLRSASDVVDQLGYTPAEAKQFFGSSRRIEPSGVKLLMAS